MRTSHSDPIDRKLIAQLEDNARISATELARRLGLARSTIHERIARLERDGIILGYSAITLRSQNDDMIRALLFLRVEQRYMRSVVTALMGFPELNCCHSVGGIHHLVCQTEVPQLDDLDALIDEIGRLPYVERVESSVILATKFDRAVGRHVQTQQKRSITKSTMSA